MKITLIAIASLLISANTFAKSQIFFGDDKAVVILESSSGDTDVVRLWNLLNVEAVDLSNDRVKKTLAFTTDRDDKPVGGLVCVLSKAAADTGTCTFIFQRSDYAIIDRDFRYLTFDAYDDLAEKIGAGFAIGADSSFGPIYGSGDSRFVIRASKGRSAVNAISFEYAE